MNELKWNYNLGQKGGQDVTQNKKTGEIKVANNTPEFSLKITIKNEDEGIDQVLAEIVEDVGGIDAVTITLAGTESQLQGKLKKIAKLISTNGGQQTLDLHLEKITN